MYSPTNTPRANQPAYDASITSPKNHRFSIGSRLADKISRVTSTRGRVRTTVLCQSILNANSSQKSVAVTNTESKRPEINSPSNMSTMINPAWLTNPRPAPKPPVEHGEAAATEGARGPFLTSALDPPEAQTADSIAFQLEAKYPQVCPTHVMLLVQDTNGMIASRSSSSSSQGC